MTAFDLVSIDELRKWNENEHSIDQVREDLKNRNINEEQIENVLKSYKKIKGEKRQMYGFIITTVGGLLCFFSCIFTLLNVIPSLRDFILYGITTIGIIVIVIGLYLVFEE